jgi:hypothetical protein
MNGLVRTTITLPSDLYESLRLQAFQQNTSFSGILKKKLGKTTQKTKKGDFISLAGSYNLKGREFNRKEFYDKLALRDMALGY